MPHAIPLHSVSVCVIHLIQLYHYCANNMFKVRSSCAERTSVWSVCLSVQGFGSGSLRGECQIGNLCNFGSDFCSVEARSQGQWKEISKNRTSQCGKRPERRLGLRGGNRKMLCSVEPALWVRHLAPQSRRAPQLTGPRFVSEPGPSCSHILFER